MLELELELERGGPGESEVTAQEDTGGAAASVWRSWLAGRCPCCGGCLDAWEDRQGTVTECLALAEGVLMCGRCVANEHGRESDRFVPALLESIVRRSDAPLEALLDEVGLEALASERQSETDREARRP